MVRQAFLVYMAKTFEVRRLSADFYREYPEDLFPEMEHKAGRPYAVLLVEIRGLVFALPLRTNIRHAYCYKFRTSDRETESATGVDYTKAVVITNDSYLGEMASINDREYTELQNKAFFILRSFERYVDGFVRFRQKGGSERLSKKYRFSTLVYFEKLILSSYSS